MYRENIYSDESCDICLESAQQPVSFPCHNTKLCYPCFRKYIEFEFKSMAYSPGSDLKCPTCETQKISLCDVIGKLNDSDQKELNEILLEKYLRSTQDVERCPLSTCSFAYLPERCMLQKEQLCPLCYTNLNRRFIFSLTPLITFIYIMFMTNNCPKCQIPIDRISGCYHMTCSCSHEFCWYCLKDYKHSSTSRYKTHNQKDCLFLLMLKLIIVFFFAFSLCFASWGNESFNRVVSFWFRACIAVLRAVAIDGAIAIQIIVLNHNAHRRNNLKKLIILFLGMDLLALFFIYLIGDLEVTMNIIGVSLLVAGAIGWIGVSVEYSLNTWFNYIR